MPKPAQNPARGSERSQETRQRLIEAALDLFGTQGYEGTTTRALAEQAQVNLAAIPYHFGGKEKLYQAIATHVVSEIRAHLAPSLFEAGALPTPEAARAQLHALIDRLVDVMTLQASERWARFIIREQLEPTPAFRILYEGFIEPMQEHVCRLIGAATGHADDIGLRLAGITLFGQIMVFRFGRPAVMHRLQTTNLGPAERTAIKRMLRFNLDAILDRGGVP